MHTDDDNDPIEYDESERRLFAALDREEPLANGETDRAVARLRRDGILGAGGSRVSAWRWAFAAAAIVLFAAGIGVGRHMARRNSLEDLLDRRDLAIGDRVLLMQRAGTAYVRAAQSYADATSKVDSGAVEVASKVLMGAAHAVARNGLDAGLTARLSTALEPAGSTTLPAVRKPVIWY